MPGREIAIIEFPPKEAQPTTGLHRDLLFACSSARAPLSKFRIA